MSAKPYAEEAEHWRPIANLEGAYEVSEHGRVRRRLHAARDGHPYHLLRPETIKGGYQRVSLSINGRIRHYLVHVLVANAFRGPCPAGHEVNHIDTNPRNNHNDNLEYLTPSQNVRHSFAGGRRSPLRGSEHHQARLNEQKVGQLLALWATGNYTKAKLAADFGVDGGTVGRIIAGKLWKHIERRAP